MPTSHKHPHNLTTIPAQPTSQHHAASSHRVSTAALLDQRTEGDDDVPLSLPPGLLWCRLCHHRMAAFLTATAAVEYDCPPGCSRPPLPAARIVDTIGRAVLQHTPRILPAATAPYSREAAATYAGRVISRLTVGRHPADLHITWRTAVTDIPRPAEHLARARTLAAANPAHARELLAAVLAAVDPATARADPERAAAAHLQADVLIRLGHPTPAIRWATYAHHAHTHLHGPAAASTLAALHTLAAAHRCAGNPQQAYHLYRHLAEQLATTTGPDAHPTLAAQASLAVVLHQLGHHARARDLLADTIAVHRVAHPGHPATARMISHLATM
ncbi:tetratricopeptide repeat protein [Micromonospora sp. NPDC050980]|uniref:tetratricopeptide repeat protein n=1 Tax=Micromonospora sp. NPDC050980 TaxID=3155161 RepID=UPI00340E2D55